MNYKIQRKDFPLYTYSTPTISEALDEAYELADETLTAHVENYEKLFHRQTLFQALVVQIMKDGSQGHTTDYVFEKFSKSYIFELLMAAEKEVVEP